MSRTSTTPFLKLETSSLFRGLGTAAAAGVVLELADYVSDPDPGEILSYAASVSGAPVVSLDLSGSQLGLRVAPASPYHFGLAEVSVTIQDRAGSSVADSFVYRHTHLTLSDDLFSASSSSGAFGSVYESTTLWEVGDLDGDGFSDAGGFTSGSGLALFFGGADGVSDTVSLSSDSSVSDFVFGPAGDVNGDGLADVWLTEGRSEVYVLFGSPSLRSLSSLDLETLPPEAGFVLGGVLGSVSVRGGHDFNQDGLSDLLVDDAHGFWMIYGGPRPLGQAISVSGPGSPPVFRQFLSVVHHGPDGRLHLSAPDSWKLGEFPYRPSGSLLPAVFRAGEGVYNLTTIENVYDLVTVRALFEPAEASSAFGLFGNLDGDRHGELAVGTVDSGRGRVPRRCVLRRGSPELRDRVRDCQLGARFRQKSDRCGPQRRRAR